MFYLYKCGKEGKFSSKISITVLLYLFILQYETDPLPSSDSDSDGLSAEDEDDPICNAYIVNVKSCIMIAQESLLVRTSMCHIRVFKSVIIVFLL